jgi:hypothetical protein
LFKIVIQGVSLWHFHVYMHTWNNLNWFIHFMKIVLYATRDRS